jgi:hypothetical protein
MGIIKNEGEKIGSLTTTIPGDKTVTINRNIVAVRWLPNLRDCHPLGSSKQIVDLSCHPVPVAFKFFNNPIVNLDQMGQTGVWDCCPKFDWS